MQSHRLVFGFAFIVLLATSPDIVGQTKDTSFQSRMRNNPISLVRLLANPEKFDGTRVTVSGYLHLRFEDAGLYLSKSDADYLNSSNALWVEISDSVKAFPIHPSGRADSVSFRAYFDCKYVTLSGTFIMANHGHMGAFSGAIESVDILSENRQWYDGSKENWKESGHGLIPTDGKP